jgi:hypothetical protein
MHTGPEEMSDAEVIKLAEAERDAGVPDVQTAEAAAAAKQRTCDDGEPEAHPS